MNLRAFILIIVILTSIFIFTLLLQHNKGLSKRLAIVDMKAPEFTLTDEEGNEIELSQFKGKTVFLHFWAAWCKECREELPGIERLYNRKKTDPAFVFLSVIWRENPNVSKKYLKENNLYIPVYTDPGSKTGRIYGLKGVPETFIIGTDGILQKRVIGPGKWDAFQ